MASSSAQVAAHRPVKSPPALLVLSDSDHPQIIEGIVTWANENGPWFIRHVRGLEPNWPSQELPRGILADSDSHIRPALETYMGQGVPAVLFSDTPLPTPARVVADNEAIGRLALSHFVDLGLGHVGYVGQPDILVSRQRRAGLAKAAQDAGVRFYDYGRNGWSATHRYQGEAEALAHWLRELPKPAGLLCVFPEIAQRMLTFAAGEGLTVPDDLAILAAEGKDVTSRMCVPSLSMIDVGEFRIGYEATELLSTMIRGADGGTHRIVVPPAGVVSRGSTDTYAVDNPELARAIRFIRTRALEPLTVEEVVSECGLSRRGLELAMRRSFGRTVQQEIRCVRVAEAKRLLSSTSLPIADIGPRCGFEWGTTLNAVFRRETGMTPRDYRKLCRGEPIARTEG